MILYNIVLTLHVLVCIVLVVVVLMQSSKGGGLAGAFGGGGDQTVFGGHETATFLSKATTYLAVLFMVLSLALAFLTSKRVTGGERSVVRRSIQEQSDVIPRGENIQEMLGASAIDTVGADTVK
jgi:preprotein translocase subunit SecG